MRPPTLLTSFVLLASTATCGGRVATGDSVDGEPHRDPAAPVPLPEITPEAAREEPESPRSRWLAYRTFVSSASTQTLLHLVDLTRPEASPIEVERQHAIAIAYSPDGRWLTYQSWRSKTETLFFLVDVSAAAPGEPRLLFQAEASRPCAWSPDSRRLACIRETDADSEVVAFDTSGRTPGPAVELGAFAPGAHPLDGVFWSDADTLVFPGRGALTRVRFRDGGSDRTSIGAPGGAIVRLTPDGRRALVTGIRDYDPASRGAESPSFRLVDLESGASGALDARRSWSFSENLDAAVASDEGARHYYRIAGTQAVLATTVATETSPEPWSREWQRPAYRQHWLGSRAVEMRGDRPVVVTIGEQGITEEIVPGDFTSVRNVRPSPDGALLYIETGELDASNRPLDAAAGHWMSRVVDGHPGPAARFASGYATAGLGSIAFSPSSKRLLLHGDRSHVQGAEARARFQLYDLEGADILERPLDVSLRSGSAVWSSDSSYLSIVGGDRRIRTSFVVAVSGAAPGLRELFTCDSNPAPLPGCPMGPTF